MRPRNAREQGRRLTFAQDGEWLTAHHEAAHVIVGEAVGLNILRASVKPDAGSLGRTEWQPAITDADQDVLCFALAGPAAEELWTGRWRLAGSDKSLCEAALARIGGDDRARQQEVARQKARALRILGAWHSHHHGLGEVLRETITVSCQKSPWRFAEPLSAA